MRYVALFLTVFGLAAIPTAATLASMPEESTPAVSYVETWEWCEEKFPTSEGQREACRWGAYEMLPGEDVPAQEGTQDV